MTGKTKLLLVLAGVIALAGLASGGTILADRVALAATPTPPDNNGTFQGCGGFGFGGYGGMMGGYGMFFDSVTLDKISKQIGVSVQDIQTQLQSGKSLVEIANGKANEQQLVDIVVAPRKETMQLRVKQGYLTQEQADQALQYMEQAAKNAVNNAWQGGQGFGPHGGQGGPGVGPGSRGGTGMMGGYGGGMMGGNGGYGGMMGGYGVN